MFSDNFEKKIVCYTTDLAGFFTSGICLHFSSLEMNSIQALTLCAEDHKANIVSRKGIESAGEKQMVQQCSNSSPLARTAEG